MKENCLWCLNQKKQNSAWKLKDGEQWKERWITKQVKEVIQHYIQSTIAKMKIFPKQ